jgi:hypothetical protein
VDDEALSVDCPRGGGVVPCDCEVDGKYPHACHGE